MVAAVVELHDGLALVAALPFLLLEQLHDGLVAGIARAVVGIVVVGAFAGHTGLGIADGASEDLVVARLTPEELVALRVVAVSPVCGAVLALLLHEKLDLVGGQVLAVVQRDSLLAALGREQRLVSQGSVDELIEAVTAETVVAWSDRAFQQRFNEVLATDDTSSGGVVVSVNSGATVEGGLPIV